MQEKSGKYYMVTALKRKYADRVPATVLIGPYCSRLAGYTVKEILTDAHKSAEAHLAFYNRFKPDSLIIYNDIYLEVEAMGCRLNFPEDQISHPQTVLVEEKTHLTKLDVPDPQKDGRLPYFLEVCERVSSRVRKEATLGLGHSGPWNLAMHLRGAESLLIDTATDPEFVHALMRFTTEVVKAVGDALIESGFSPSIGEAYATCSLISPKIYTDFIMPYHKQLCEYFKSKKAFMSLHICGQTDAIMADIMDSGIAFFSLDAPSSLEKFLKINAGKIPVMGNVATTLFSNGTRTEMEAAIRRCIDTAAAGSGYILASGCEIPLNSTADRVAHFFDYGRQYSRQFMQNLKEHKPQLFQD